MPHQVPWLVFFLPLLSFLVIGLVLRPFFSYRPKWSGYAAIAAIGSAFVL